MRDRHSCVTKTNSSCVVKYDNKNRNKQQQQQQQLELVVELMFCKKLLEIGPSIFRLPFSLQFSLVFLFPLEWTAKGREGKGRAAGVSYLAFHVSSSRFHSSHPPPHTHSLSPRLSSIRSTDFSN